MSIFRRETDDPRPAGAGPATTHTPPSPAPERRPNPASAAAAGTTHIAPGAKITGQVNGNSDLVVDGELEGQVHLDSNVTIGAEGKVQGDIVAKSVRIGGRVVGNVQGLEKVEILPTGRLEGDVAAPRVVLAEGAFFKGKVEMTGKPAAAKAGGVAPVGAAPKQEGPA
ncbi:MAG TPA: polymer-forming cytoskeletal protein [Thermoanaerobaculia bacterium]|jgi:cytoskeletal protein CcmA (bactofilin family)|nr:polymer-forming cytoskeletal protein [Thermoanaerobaculia bacterium]